jgi:hypothetical protein
VDSHPDPRGLSSDRGFATTQFVLVAGLSLVFLVLVLNLVVVQYAAGVMRAAVDEGVRRGAPAPAGEAECLAGIDGVLEGLLAGPMGDSVSYHCEVAEMVEASAAADFPAWLPGLEAFHFEYRIRAVKESSA